jgi:hypothetical protein
VSSVNMNDMHAELDDDGVQRDIVEPVLSSNTDESAITGTTSSTCTEDDMQLLQKAETHVAEEQLLQAARLFRQISNQALLTHRHRRVLDMAIECEKVVTDLLGDPDKTWTKQSESHGNWDTRVYYKVHQVQKRHVIVARIESPIPSDLLVPLLSVLNESDLYSSWMPSWKHPKLGVESSQKLRDFGRGNQVIAVRVRMPLLFSDRESITHAYGKSRRLRRKRITAETSGEIFNSVHTCCSYRRY